VRDRDERPRFRRPVFTDRGFRKACEPVCCRDGEQREDEGQEAPQDECNDETEREPHESVRADSRQEDEDVVERTPPVVNDPPLG